MPREVVQGLRLAPGLMVLDGTVGAGGHSRLMLDAIQPGGQLLGLDRDPMMLAHARQKLPESAAVLHQSSYAEMEQVLQEFALPCPDRILLDLGLSSDQLSDNTRSFSFQADGALDLRFDTTQGRSAEELLATESVEHLTAILADLGEEPKAAAIAEQIVASRKGMPLRTGRQLAQLVEKVVSGGRSGQQERHTATRTFQALRIAVNQELEHVVRGLVAARTCLKPGGLFAVITFHSLEDRLVKQEFRERSWWTSITDKPVAPSPAEIRFNPRSRSAKLRIVQRTAAKTPS